MYLISIFFFINYNSPFIFWVMTELNLILFVLLISSLSMDMYKQEMRDLIMFYFVIQSVASILILSDFFLSAEFYIFNSDVMFMSGMFIKLGVFPFFFWVFKICQFLSFKILSVLLSIQKIPFFLVLFNCFSLQVSPILFISFLVGSVLVFYSSNLVFMIVASSLSSSYWIFYLYGFSLYFFLMYFFLYGLFIFLFLPIFHNQSGNSSNFIFSLTLFSFLLGLSPLSLFFFKLYTMHFLLENYKILEVTSFWLFSFMCLLGYVKFSYSSFFFKFELYFNNYSMVLKKLLFSFFMMVFFCFVIY